jgi:hypothetical protein
MTPFQTFADEDLADPAAAHGDAVNAGVKGNQYAGVKGSQW